MWCSSLVQSITPLTAKVCSCTLRVPIFEGSPIFCHPLYLAGAVYSSGQIAQFDGKTVVINAGGEHLDLFRMVCDTLMIVNVLEHVNNAIAILRNVYNALRPGGLLIFSDRWWDDRGEPPQMMGLDAV